MKTIEGVAKIDKTIGAYSVWGEAANKEIEISDTESLADSSAYRLIETAVHSIQSTPDSVREKVQMTHDNHLLKKI